MKLNKTYILALAAIFFCSFITGCSTEKEEALPGYGSALELSHKVFDIIKKTEDFKELKILTHAFTIGEYEENKWFLVDRQWSWDNTIGGNISFDDAVVIKLKDWYEDDENTYYRIRLDYGKNFLQFNGMENDGRHYLKDINFVMYHWEDFFDYDG